MGEMEKRRFSHEEALAVAEDVIGALEDRCERICYAGSLRRRRLLVKDVEILFIPKMAPSLLPAADLFDLGPEMKFVNQAEEMIEHLLKHRLLTKRANVNGKEAWGEKNKLAIHQPSGIPVDLFTATSQNFFNYLVCRTGGVESNIRIASAAKAHGWKWNPYGSGFSHENGMRRDVASEREVFEFVGLPYLEPWQR